MALLGNFVRCHVLFMFQGQKIPLKGKKLSASLNETESFDFMLHQERKAYFLSRYSLLRPLGV